MCEFFYLRFIGKIIKRLTQVTVVPQSPSNFLDVPTCVKLLCERTLENSAKVLRGIVNVTSQGLIPIHNQELIP